MPRKHKTAIDGILNIDKPYGITSMDVVRQIKRASGQRRVGHGGTLDPVATGVIPICLGQATRMMEDLVNGFKTYRAGIVLGVTTDTYDALGEVTARCDASDVSLADVERAIQAFNGTIQQVPPMYSALKRDGKRLYDLARAGVEIEREPRPVIVHSIALLNWSPPTLTLEVSCGRGFYMRSLAHDLGQALGCGGYLETLARLRTGAFTLDKALSLDDAIDCFADGSWGDVVQPPDVALHGLPAVIVGKRLEDMLRNGRSIDAAIPAVQGVTSERCRAYTVDGRFLAVLQFDEALRQWRPHKVFALNYHQPAEMAYFT